LGKEYNYIHVYNLQNKTENKFIRLPKASFSKAAPFVYDDAQQTLLFTQSLTPQSDINRIRQVVDGE
jgi:hypothetical protein